MSLAPSDGGSLALRVAFKYSKCDLNSTVWRSYTSCLRQRRKEMAASARSVVVCGSQRVRFVTVRKAATTGLLAFRTITHGQILSSASLDGLRNLGHA